MYRRAARGETVGFVYVDKLDELIETLKQLMQEGFSGRLTGVVGSKSKQEEFTILVKDNQVIMSFIGGRPVQLREVIERIVDAEEGFIEVQRLSDAGIRLEIDYIREQGIEVKETFPLETLITLLKDMLQRRRHEVIRRTHTAIEEFMSKIEIDREMTQRVNEAYAKEFERLVKLVDEADSRYEMQTRNPETVLKSIMARLEDGKYTLVYARYGENEILLAIRGKKLCFVLEKTASGTRPASIDSLEKLAESQAHYVISSSSTQKLDDKLGLCVTNGSESSVKGEERGFLKRLRSVFLGRK